MNNDKALASLDRLLKYALHEAKAEQDLFANDDYQILEQSLTPQSSADLGRVLRERVEGMKKPIPDMPVQSLYKSYAEYIQDYGLSASERTGAITFNAACDQFLRILDEVMGRE